MNKYSPVRCDAKIINQTLAIEEVIGSNQKVPWKGSVSWYKKKELNKQ